MSLLRSTAVIGGLTGVSRVLGFVREAMIAAVLGAGPVADAFYTALRFPNLFRRLLAEGAFNSAFVPLYARRLEAERLDPEAGGEAPGAAQAFASETLSALACLLLILVVAAQLAMPWIMVGFAPGYAGDPGWMAKAVLMTQITMPYIAFMSLMAMFGGVLNAHGRFALFALAPTILNVVLIAILWRVRGAEAWDAAVAMSIGVAVSGVLQCALVYWGLARQGIRLRLRPPRLTPGVRRLAVLGFPGAISAGVTQINIVVSQIIATLQEGAVSWLSYADRLYQLPLGMIGIAMGVALLPALSRRVRADDLDGARASLNRAAEIAAFLTAPAAVALMVAPEFFVRGMFEEGAFDAADTVATASALQAFAVGLPAFIAIKVFAPGFYAREDTATPMRYAIVAVVINVVLGVALFFQIGFVGLAIATTVAAWVNAGLLISRLLKDGLFRPDARLISRLARISMAAAACAALVAYGAQQLNPLYGVSIVRDLSVCIGFGLACGLAYVIAAFALGGARISDIRSAMRRSPSDAPASGASDGDA